MNNEDLKKFLKENINLNIHDCLNEIKETEVEVLPCTLKHHIQYGKAIRYSLYAALGLSILGSSSYTAYNYVTPETYINIEISNPKASLATNTELDDFTIQVNLNGFDKVIDVNSTINDIKNECNISNLDYIDAYPILMDFIEKNTSGDTSIIFTVISNNEEKTFTIEEALASIEDYYIHINDIVVDKTSSLKIGQQKAIEMILKKSKDYQRSDLETKSLKQLIEILLKI